MSSSSSTAAVANTAGDAAPHPGEEGILVAIRMRPLNSRESAPQNNRVWRVLQKYNSVTQCTSSGKPLPERIQQRNFFTYDKTFGESSTTRDVYDDTSRGIVDSVANGLNGTIFAYGQTSSGKTFTMQGSGTLQEGASVGGGSMEENGGIVHMAASDIFNHIEKEPERVFLVRVSFIEIYNEEVRDLLVSGDSKDNSTLTVREDKRRGVFVNSNETIVTSMDSLLSVLFAGEKNRSVAATMMNERSSRSHTIFKITVESRLKQTKKDGEEAAEEEEEEEEESDEDEDVSRGDDNVNGAVRISTLNLVDLAGSESVRHTGATGDRQKEGGKINQSLLTLSRVIGSLGQNATHVNFRDSKLTRILQPSLSGNARMAVICCATPSELYMEETRSTLQFASRAKLVKTRAQVNEVMDDRSLIKKLQRELKEARMGGPGKETTEQMKALEEKAASAEFANRKAEDHLKRMKKLILRGGVLPNNASVNGLMVKPSLYNSLFVYNNDDGTIKTGADKLSLRKSTKGKSKRRYSDGVINETENNDPQQQGPYSSPCRGGNIKKLQAQTEMKSKKSKPTAHIMSSAKTDDVDIGIVREALAAKSAQAASLKVKLNEAAKQSQAAMKKLQSEHGEKEMLRLAKEDLEYQVSMLASDKEFVLNEQDILMEDKESVIATSLEKIENMLDERKQQALMVSELQTLVESLQGQLTEKEEGHENIVEQLNGQISRQQEDATRKLAKLEGKLEAAITSNISLTDQLSSLQKTNNNVAQILSEREAALEETKSNNDAMKESLSVALQLSNEVTELRNAKVAADEKVLTLEGKLGVEQSTVAAKAADLEGKLEAAMYSNTNLTEQVSSLQNTNDDVIKQLHEKETSFAESKSDIAAMEEEASSATLQLADKVTELCNAKQEAEENITTLEGKLEVAITSNTLLVDQTASLQNTNDDVATQLREQEAALEESQSNIAVLKEEASSVTLQLSEKVAELCSTKQAAEEHVSISEGKLEAAITSKTQLAEQVTSLQNTNDEVSEQLHEKEAALEESKCNIAVLKEEASSVTLQLSDKVTELRNEKQSAEEHVSISEGKLEALIASNTQLAEQVSSLQNTNGDVARQLHEKEAEFDESKSNIASLKEEASSATLLLSYKVTELCNGKRAAEESVTALGGKLDTAIASYTQMAEQVLSLQNTNSDMIKQLHEQESALEQSKSNVTAMKEDASSTKSQISDNMAELCNAKQEAEGNVTTLEGKLEVAIASMTQMAEQVSSLQNTNNVVAKQLHEKETSLEESWSNIAAMEEEASSTALHISDKVTELCNAKQAAEENTTTLEGKLEAAITSNTQLADQIASLQNTNDDVATQLHEKEAALEEFKCNIAVLKEEASCVTLQLSDKLTELRNVKQAADEIINSLDSKLEAAITSNAQMVDQVASVQNVNDHVATQLWEKEAELDESKSKESSAMSQLSEELTELHNAKQAVEESISFLESKLEAAIVSNTQLTDQVGSLQNANGHLAKQLLEQEAALEESKSKSSSATLQLSEEVTELRNTKGAVEERVTILEKSLDAEQLATQELERQLEIADDDVVRLAKEANMSNEMIQELQSNAEGAMQSLQDAVDVNKNLQTKYAAATKVEKEHRENTSKLEATIMQRDQAATTSNETITLLKSKVSTLSSERDELAKKVESTNEKLLSLQEAMSSSMSKMEELGVKIEELDAERDTAQGRVKELIYEMESNKNAITAMQLAKDDIVLKLEVSESEKEECLNEAEAAIDDREKMLTEIEAIETKHTHEIELLKYQSSEATSQITKLTNQISSMSAEKKDLLMKIESTSSGLTATGNEISKLKSNIESLTAERDASNEQVSQFISESKSADEVLSSLKSELEKTKTDKACLEMEKGEMVAKLNSSEDSVVCLSANLDTSKSKCNNLKSELEAVTTKCNNIESEQKQCSDKLEGITGDNNKLRDTITNLKVVIQQKTGEANLSMQERYELATKVDEATVELSKLAAERGIVEVRMEEMLFRKTKSEEEKSAIHSEKEALGAKVKEGITQLELERAEVQVNINGLNAKIAELQGRNKGLANDLYTSKSEVNELLSQAEKSEANYKALESEKEKCFKKLQDEISATVANLQNSLAEKSNVISQLNDKLTVSVANNHDVDSNAVDTLKKEIIELKSLLSSANASVGEARSAALSADQELEEMELQLENALRNLAEHEEARRIAEDQLRLGELSPRNSPARADPEEELLRDMEVLMGEKIDAESRLEQELNRRNDIEDEIKKAAEEEKQLLIDDAEKKIISLRDEISQLKSDLSRIESDCYNTKDENAELHDKIKRVETKAKDSESIVASINDELSQERKEKNEIQERLDGLGEESTTFKSQVFAAKNAFEAAAQAELADVEEQLNDVLSHLAKSRNDTKLSRDMIADLSSDVETYRTELASVKGMASNSNEIELSKLREEVAETKLNLSQEKANYFSVKRDLESAKEKVDRIKRHEHEKYQKFAAKAKEAIETLKDRLVKSESALKDSVANNATGVGVDSLQKEMKELTSTLRDKDERIKKLERSKITKTQIANIQKLKDERNQFMAEVKEYKQRVEVLENPKPRRSGLRERKVSSDDQSTEVGKLQNDLRQCENKLRKYVQHSERLEKDRKGVIEAISSCDVGDIVGDGIVEMVVSLCDRLVSIEEECDALASSEGKAAEYLTELDSLQGKHAALECKVQSYEANDSKLAISLAEGKANLKKAQEKIAALMKDKESLQAMAESAKGNISELQSERRRQLNHLSNENLQLGDELKRTKKELTETKTELDAVQTNAFNSEQTEELEGLSNILGPSASTKRAPLESASKHPLSLLSGSKRIPLSSSRKRFHESPITKEGGIDKENLLNKKQRTLSSPIKSPFSSAKKKRSTNPFSSVKKAARRTKKTLMDDSPTKQYVLGDSEPTADVTGECNQS